MAFVKLISNPKGILLNSNGDLDEGLREAIEKRNSFAISLIFAVKLCLAFLGGDYRKGVEYGELHFNWTPRPKGSIHEAYCLLFESLTAFALARCVSKTERKENIRRGLSGMKTIKKLAHSCPTHCLAKFIVFEAETAALAGKHSLAEEKYTHAILLSRKYNNMFEEGLLNLVTGYYFIRDRKDIGKGLMYLEDSCKVFESLGGLALVTLVGEEIDNLKKNESNVQ